MNVLVLDFGGSSVKYSQIDERKRRTHMGQIPAPLESKEHFVGVIRTLYEKYRGQVDGIAVSMPGFIHGPTGFLRTAGAYTKMYGCNLYDMLRNEVQVPVVVENDGKCAAYAETWIGNLQGVQEAAVVILGTGLAGGIIHEGKLLRGFSGTAGEFSFIQFPASLILKDSPLFRCSMAGVTLSAAAALGIDLKRCPYYWMNDLFRIDNTYRSKLDHDPRFVHGIDGQLFFELLEEGNHAVKEIYDTFTQSVAGLLMSVQAVMDPEYIAVGGNVTRQNRFLEDIEKQIKKYDAFLGGNSLPQIRIRKCGAGSSPNEYGAAYNFFRQQGMSDSLDGTIARECLRKEK